MGIMTLRRLPQKVYRQDGARRYVQRDRLYAEHGREQPPKWSVEAMDQAREQMEETLLARLLKIVDGEFDLRILPDDGYGHLIQIGRWTCNVQFHPGRIKVGAWQPGKSQESTDVPLPKSGRKWPQVRRDLMRHVRWYSDMRASWRMEDAWRQALSAQCQDTRTRIDVSLDRLWTDRLARERGEETADLTIQLRDVSIHAAGRLVTLLQSVGITAYTMDRKGT